MGLLYSHQRDAIERMSNGCLLCGGVGTGKSRTALAYFYEKVCGGRLPRSTGDGWSEPDMIPLYIITTARKRDSLEWEGEMAIFGLTDVVVDSWNNVRKYQDVENAFFIFDEQRVVGSGSWAKSFIKIAKRNQWILLSATPGDTWMDYISVFVANGFYKNRTEFIRNHVVYDHFVKYPKVKLYLDEPKLEQLRDSILITMDFQKTATQHHEWVKIGYDESLYSDVSKRRWNIYTNEPCRNISEMCYIWRKILNSDDRRLEAVDSLLVKHPRMIIFYNFDYELEMLQEYARSTGILYSEWNGHRHEELPEGKRWLYFVQYTAGAEAWNCTATDTILFFSQSYSYKTTVQASGRIDRMNTPFTDLYYFHLFSDGPIDRAIRQCLVKKRQFNEKSFVRDQFTDYNEEKRS